MIKRGEIKAQPQQPDKDTNGQWAGTRHRNRMGTMHPDSDDQQNGETKEIACSQRRDHRYICRRQFDQTGNHQQQNDLGHRQRDAKRQIRILDVLRAHRAAFALE